MVRNNLYNICVIIFIVINKIKLYQEPEIDDQGKYIKKPLDEEQKKKKLDEDLKEGVLKINCGVPIVFVINKADVVTQSSEKKKFEENSEFILHHIRSIAIEYGATIVYTSAKANSNVNILYDYICHILFRFDLVHKPNLIDKEAYFIPSGYDNLPLLNSNEEQNKYLDTPYDKKITPVVKANIPEEDIQCEDTNTFFESLKQMGVKGKDKMAARNRLSAGAFMDYKTSNINGVDMKNYETNVTSLKNIFDDKEKKYEDKRKAIKEKIGNNASFSKRESLNREIKGKGDEDPDLKKQKVREAMLAKIGKGKIKKTVDNKQ